MSNDLVRAVDELLRFAAEPRVLDERGQVLLAELDAAVYAAAQQLGLELPPFSQKVHKPSFEFGNCRLLATRVMEPKPGLGIWATTNWRQALRTLKATAERVGSRTEDGTAELKREQERSEHLPPGA
jgi:hypothetical protein